MGLTQVVHACDVFFADEIDNRVHVSVQLRLAGRYRLPRMEVTHINLNLNLNLYLGINI